MRRQVIIGSAAGVAVITGIGALVLAVQQGWLGGKDRQLYARGNRALQQQQFVEAQEAFEELIATFPESPWADDGLLKLGETYQAQQQLVEAQSMYRMLLERFPDSSLMTSTQQHLGDVNIALLFSPMLARGDATYEVRSGDTLGKIASAHHTTIDLIKKANGLDSDVIRLKQKLKVPQGHFSIVVDKSQNQLLLTENNEFVKSYLVATGKDNSTPVGTFTIVNRIPNPVWYTQGAVVPPDSPENILGTRWLGLDKKGYGIHGSVDLNTMGQQVTAGCVRMTNSDVEELFAIVPVGTEVTIVD